MVIDMHVEADVGPFLEMPGQDLYLILVSVTMLQLRRVRATDTVFGWCRLFVSTLHLLEHVLLI
jgi:hypothetical protein